MSWRRWLIALHRDVGYFFTGVIVLYSISGIAVNHIDQWNPNFVVERREVSLDLPREPSEISSPQIQENLARLGAAGDYLSFDFPSASKVKIYLKNGSILATLRDGKGCYETIRRRPLMHQINMLHLNPDKWWRVFSDVFAGGLIFLALSGVCIAKGRYGFLGRGKWLVGAGLVVPLAAMFLV
ncbi:MAG TPA: PepSY-associated TM helix domain-containing protein [Lacipirellula sp.]